MKRLSARGLALGARRERHTHARRGCVSHKTFGDGNIERDGLCRSVRGCEQELLRSLGYTDHWDNIQEIEASHAVFDRFASAACAFAARCSRTALFLSSALASTGAVVLGATLAEATLGSGALAATAAASADVASGAPSTEPTCVKAQLKIRWQEAR